MSVNTSTRKCKANPDKWQKNLRKRLRQAGSEYTDTKGKIVEAREMKDIDSLKSIVHSFNVNTKGCNKKLQTNTDRLSIHIKFVSSCHLSRSLFTSFCIPLPLKNMRTYKVFLKRLRQAGSEYTDTKGKIVEAREMKDID
jgi:hypothetical protein